MTARTFDRISGVDGMICTFTGTWINPLHPEPEQIFIEDIAHALSNLCRFTGHTKSFYSVAQHSVYASLVAENKFYALMHDASEAYLADIARPIKMQPEFGTLYKLYEDRLMDAISDRFGLPKEMPADVKQADNDLLWAEIRDLMPNDIPEECTPVDFEIIGWTPETAEEAFLARYSEVSGS